MSLGFSSQDGSGEPCSLSVELSQAVSPSQCVAEWQERNEGARDILVNIGKLL